MKLLLLANILMFFQSSDSLISTPNLEAFTHTKFFFSHDCRCGMFNPNYFQLEIFNMPTDLSIPYTPANSYIVPLNFEIGHAVIIIGEQSDFFKIKFNDKFGDNPINSQCIDCSYFVKKGTLGTWVFNFDNSTQEYVPVPFYQKPCENSKMITRLKKDDSVVVILDIQENWMYVETITQGKKKRGWLDPKMQCGNPYGIDAGVCR